MMVMCTLTCMFTLAILMPPLAPLLLENASCVPTLTSSLPNNGYGMNNVDRTLDYMYFQEVILYRDDTPEK
jgi:hypothetical protein